MKKIKQLDIENFKYVVDSTDFWNKEELDSYDNGTSEWLVKEAAIVNWCNDYPSQGRYSFCESTGRFYFESEQDMMLTTLRWS